jgi:hypothetical protein
MGDAWSTAPLPIQVPTTTNNNRGVGDASADPLCLTAYQYVREHPGSDLNELLAQQKAFDAAMLDTSAAPAC